MSEKWKSEEQKTETFSAQIIEDGRITIPETTRRIVGLKKGDIAKFTVEKVDLEE